MPALFLTLILDAQLDQGVRQLWEILVEEGVCKQSTERHRPHVTLCGYDVADPASCIGPLGRFCSNHRPVPVRFHHVGFFPERSVLFLQPMMTRSLLTLHRSVIEELAPDLGNSPRSPNFAVDHWTPHCTLADCVPRDLVGEAVRLLQEHWRVLEGYAVGIGALVPPATVDMFQCQFGDPVGVGNQLWTGSRDV